MYTVVVADDEAIERKAILLLMKKELPYMNVIDTAANGKDLIRLVMYKKPDIAIVDINMPGLNGIDAIDTLKAKGSETKFIILTAYDDFDYVQRALSLKIEAYILKPEKKEETIKTLIKVCQTVDQDRDKKCSQDKMNVLIDRMQPLLESEIMFSIFVGELALDSIHSYLGMKNIIFNKGLMMTLIPVSKIKDESHDKKRFREMVGAVSGQSCSFLCSVTESSISICFIFPDNEEIRERIEKIAGNIILKLKEAWGVLYRVGISGIYGSFQDMPQAYKESMSALKPDANTVGLKGKENVAFYQNYSEASEETATEENKMENLHVRAAYQYIEEHYHQDISLDMVAEKVGISPFYLSRLFKQECGRNFIEYLTMLRVEKAKELARNTKMSIVEISECIGYQNATYFCRIFKKSTGKTIGSYRDEFYRRQY